MRFLARADRSNVSNHLTCLARLRNRRCRARRAARRATRSLNLHLPRADVPCLASSAALIGFGLDSVVEVTRRAVTWQFATLQGP